MGDISRYIEELSPKKRQLYELLLKEKSNKHTSPPQTIPRTQKTGTFPLSFAQQRLWFLNQLEPDSASYNIPMAVRLTGPLNVEALERSLNEIMRRHEVLQANFSTIDGQPVQTIAPISNLTLPVVDFSKLPEAEREARVQRTAIEEAQRPYDLAKDSLLRTTLLRLSEEIHVLLLTVHHIVADDWSLGIFTQELVTLYQAFSNGRPSPLPELPIQYTDFAAWQREWLQGEALETQFSYWKEQLKELPVLDLPTDRPRPPIQTYGGARESLPLSKSLVEALNNLSQQEGVTLFMTLVAAFKVLLYRYTGQEDIFVGSVVANRDRTELQGLIGFFVNTFVLRTDLSGNPGFEELLRRVRKVAVDAYAHQDLPFEKLVEKLQPQRDLSRSPLFQVMFTLQSAKVDKVELDGLTLSSMGVAGTSAKFDLTLDIIETQQGLVASCEYNTDLFDPATITRLLEHYQSLLEGIIANPEQLISDLPLLTQAEQLLLLEDWNKTRVDYLDGVCLPHLFETQVERTPEAIALVFEDQQLTYRELNRRANQLGHYLQKLDVGPDVIVGLCVDRSLEMVVGILGILKAGGAYLPLEPTYPDQRLVYMLENAQVSILLTQKRLAGKIPEHEAKEICLDEHWDLIAKESETSPPGKAAADNLAYVIYTSGSLGKPKGVQIPHSALVNFIHSMRQEPGLTSQDRLVAVTTLSFDIAALELFLPLIIGARLVLVSHAVASDGGALSTKLVEAGATTMQATPATWRLLLESGWTGSESLKILCGGEALPRELANRLLSKGASLWNLYGPTETTVWSTVYQVEAGDRSVSIGRPIANTQIYLLDAYGHPVPVGVAGELYIGGAGLSRGYLNQPGLTAEKFVPNPFSTEPGARLYRTGDLARYRPDGSIEFLGRIDYQVKVRGFRIEIEEIEGALLQHPEVREAVVTTHEAPGMAGAKQLVAYYVPDPDHLPTTSQLRSHLREKLPEYMVPSIFLSLKALPLTPNGKVNRGALPALDTARMTKETPFVAPRTPVEEVMVEIWAEVLGLDRIGVYDNFFELGGHSLLVAQLVSRLHEAFQVKLPMRSLFEHFTVADLAEVVAKHSHTLAPPEALPSITPAPDQRYQPFPLNEMQQAYWVGRSGAFDLGNVATHGYVELEGVGLDVERLTLAWRRLIERHDALRIVVLPDGQQQILAQVPPYQIEVLNLRGEAPDTVTAQLEAIRQRLSHQVMETDEWPLFELRATYLDGGRVRLHISFDLLISDAWSFRILVRELSQLYQNPDTSFESLELSYRDYVLGEIALQKTELYQQSLDYWRNCLLTLPPAPELPLARNPGSLTSPRFVRRSGCLSPDTWRQLKAQAARRGLTPPGVLLAAYAEVLATWSKSPQFTINVPRFNRLPLHPQVNDIVGEFASFTLLPVDHSAEDTFEARARRLQKQLWEHLNYSYVSGVRILRELAQRQKRTLGGVMPVVFTSAPNTGRVPDTSLANAPENLGDSVYSITQTSQIWLDNQGHEEAGSLIFNWDAIEDLFPKGLLDDMFDAYGRLLQQLADEDIWKEPVLRLIPPAQLEQRAMINATEASIPEEMLHTLVIKQASQRPQQIAVIASGETLTYEELLARSTRLGRQLRELGARPDTLVAVVMEKGWEQIVAVLGILQAGAACLPITPELPKERLGYLLEDGQVEWVLTQPWLDKKLPWPERVQRIQVDNTEPPHLNTAGLEPRQTPDDLAYVIYTSGSTGYPKGVMLTHRGLVNAILHTNQYFTVGPEDRVLSLTPLNHDMSIYDIFGLLAAGGTIIMPDASARRDPAHWAELMIREQVTIWNSVPAMMEMLLTHAAGRSELIPASLRLAFLGGDWIAVSLPDRLMSLAENVQIVSVGGPTETTLWNIWYPVGRVDPGWKSIPYGQPIANTQYYVLNEALENCPVWAPGQLYCAGVGVAKGYWGDEDKTRARFIQHPRTGQRLYATGDMGRYLPDGNIEFMGRIDFQIKIMGRRIEPGEIETALNQHPAVKTSVVTPVGEPQGNKRLVAYIVPDQKQISAINASRRSPNRDLPGDDERHQAEKMLVDPIERLEFKLGQPGVRKDNGDAVSVKLIKPKLDEAFLDRYIARRSYRKFIAQPIPLESFSRLLNCLLQVEFEGLPFPKYQYASGGGLYPVQVYLHVKPDRVEGVPAGTYYYHPKKHCLVLLSDETCIDRSVHVPNNRDIFDQSAFSIFLIGQLDAMAPMYGEESSKHYISIEAGLITQLLEMTAPTCQVGLCQIGTLDFNRIRHLFALEERHVFLHSMLGGRIDIRVDKYQALLEDWSAYQVMLPSDQRSNTDSAIVSELRDFLRQKLPEYMIPATFVAMEALPLTRNGKIDRHALPAPDETSLEREDTFVAPRTPVEEKLAEIWSEILDLERVGIYDNFLEVGGHSLLAVQLISRIRDVFQIQLPLRKLFESPTVAGLAENIETTQWAAQGLQEPASAIESNREEGEL